MKLPITFNKRYAILACSIMMALPMLGQAAEFSWYDGRWAHEQSDIKPDSRITFGTLANGLRWAVIPNANPKGRVSLYLDIQVGSLMEEEKELGIAHYLEHMAFNGSRHFKPGELIPFFQTHGMNFGGDTNAHTTLHETVYKLNLADTSHESVSNGLKILRDVADGLDLAQDEVNNERGVILAEKRSRESETVLAARQWRQFLYTGSRFTHDTIGTQSSLNTIDQRALRNFYTKWYVPGRMILVIAGDVKASDVKPLIESHFADMTKPAKLPELETFGAIDRTGVKALVQERPITSTSVNVLVLHDREYEKDNLAQQRRLYIDSIIRVALQRRLMQYRDTHANAWTKAFVRCGWRSMMMPAVQYTATTDGKHWKEALEGLSEEMNRARQFGLTEQEFSDIKHDITRMLERAVRQESAWTNEDYAQAFVTSANNDRVFTSAKTDLAIYKDMESKLTLKDVNDALKAMLAPENRRILVSGNVKTTEREVLDYWTTLQKKAVSVAQPTETTIFPYLTLPAEVKSVTLTPNAPVGDASLGAEGFSLTLANGTQVRFVKTPFEAGTVRATYTFGDGLDGLSENKTNIARMAIATLGENGVGRLTALEHSKMFGARGLSVSESLGSRYNLIGGQAQSADALLLLQAIWTQYQDPTLTQANYERVVQSVAQSQYRLEKTVEGVMRTQRSAFLTGDRARSLPLTEKEARVVTISQMQCYIKDSRSGGPRSLVISGDFDEKAVAREAVRLFGSIKVLRTDRQHVAKPPVFPDNQTRKITVKGDNQGKAFVHVSWHSDLPDISDRKKFLARSLLGSVVRDRMRVQLRENEAVAYSPSAAYRSMDLEKGFGYLSAEVETKLEAIEKSQKIIQSIVESILNDGISEDELKRQLRPRLTNLATVKKKTIYWHNNNLTELATDLPTIAWVQSQEADLKSITIDDLMKEAQIIFSAPSSLMVIQSEK
ncbi:MAG: insulinase family protein [Burkholderiaceae bacterium]|nr:insulinase family protein [Burkholderiaceae bacterium]